MLIDAMITRARAGVDVRLVVDSIGSALMTGEPARRLREAGCKLEFYQPLTWYRLHRLNNRTHRELLIVDGRVAFTGAPASRTGGSNRSKTGPRGATRWCESKDRSSPPFRGSLPKTGSSAAARF